MGKKKDIQIGEYWTVNYSNYKGIVLVVEAYSYPESGYSCIIAKDLPKKWINHYSGCRFTKREFRKKTTEKAFLKQRSSYLLAQANKCKKQIDKLSRGNNVQKNKFV